MKKLNLTLLVICLALTSTSCSNDKKPMASDPALLQQPSGTLVAPVSGKGMAETFTVRFDDPRGAQTINGAGIIINDTLGHENACYVYYNPTLRQITLMDDTKTLWLPGIALGNIGQVRNAQCSVDASKSSVITEGTGLTIKAAVTFAPSFSGEKKIFLYGTDQAGAKTGYLVVGHWTVADTQ